MDLLHGIVSGVVFGVVSDKKMHFVFDVLLSVV